MSTLTVSTHVSAPVEQTFKVFTEIEKAADRISGITSLELLSEGPFGEGTRWRETRLMFKKEAVEEMWVTAFNPPQHYTVEAESHGTKYSTLISFTPDGEGTKVTWAFTGTPISLGAKIMAPIFGLLMSGMMKRCMLGDLEALRDACESGEG